MRVVRGITALILALLLSLTFGVAHAEDSDGGTTEPPATTQTPEPTDPAPTDTVTPDEPTPTEDTPTPDPTDGPTDEPSDTPSDEPSDDTSNDPTGEPGADQTVQDGKGVASKLAALLARPVAVNDLFSVATNTGAFPSNIGLVRGGGPLGVYRNDVPTEGGDQTPNSIVLADTVDHGTLDLNSNGGFHYVPSVGFTGTDSFQYRYATDDGESDSATVTLVVGSGGLIATDDHYITAPDTQLVVARPGVSSNDSEIATFGFNVTNSPDHGSLTQPGLLPGGRFTYTPDADFVGVDTFTYRYRLLPFQPYSNTATVTIIVGEPPVAEDDDYELVANSSLHVHGAGVMANDTGTGTVAVVGDVSHGTLELDADGSFDYVPAEDFVGIDTFTYRLTDPVTTLSDVATVTLEVEPVASNDAYGTPIETLLTVDAPGIFADDTPATGGLPTVTDDVDNGTLTLADDGGFTYLPDPDFVGIDTFSYSFESAGIDSNEATVTITVWPVAVDDEITVPTCEDTRFNTLGNDLGADALTSPTTIIDAPEHGELAKVAEVFDNASFIYQPDEGFVGDDTFTYAFSTNELLSTIATVTVHVTSCDDGSGGGDGSDGDQALPDTGAPMSPWLLALAGVSVIAGAVLIRRRGAAKA